jgi:peptidoglycan/LPS O-acetylase OafA/YrhL
VRALALVGVASYSVYVWHVPILQGLYSVPGLAGSVPRLLAAELSCALAVAGASYLLLERPALRLRRMWADPMSHPVPAEEPVVAPASGEVQSA